MKKAVVVFVGSLILFTIFLVIRAVNKDLSEVAPAEVELPVEIVRESESETFLKAFQGAIQIETVSDEKQSPHSSEFKQFRSHLKKSFPKAFASLQEKVFDGGSILLHWKTESKAKPILFLAHMDVVPVDSQFVEEWDQPPFSGNRDGDYIYGRGTLDDKASVIGLLAAVESYLMHGQQPSQDIFIALGHDEEIGGKNGAVSISNYLKESGLRFEWVLDEGGMDNDGSFFGSSHSFALVGLGEKGFCNFRLKVNSTGGHSSTPPRETSISILSKAIEAVTNGQPSARFTPITKRMLQKVAVERNFVTSVLMNNLWLFSPIVKKQLSESPITNAILRTTLTPTMLSAGVKSNVLAKEATSVINARILPGDTVQSITEHLVAVVNDPRVKVEVEESVDCSEASNLSPQRHETFNKFSRLVRSLNPEVSILPYLLVAATDARHYESVSENVYRYIPYEISKQDVSRIHGVNERIKTKDFQKIIKFYQRAFLFSEI